MVYEHTFPRWSNVPVRNIVDIIVALNANLWAAMWLTLGPICLPLLLLLLLFLIGSCS
jgi:hypothetical protein